MNLLDLTVSLSVEENNAPEHIKKATDAMIDEAERADKAFEDMADGIQNSFSKIADEGFLSSFSDILGDEGKLLDFGNLIGTGLSWIGLGIMTTAEGAKKAAEQYSESVQNMVLFNGPVESMAENLDTLKERYSEFMELQAATGGYGFDFKAFSEVLDAIDVQKIAMVEAAVLNLGLAYEEARNQVSGWFGLFEKAEQIQTASLDEMAANIQSQIDYNRDYQASLETLTDAGYGELAAQMQELGKSGAGYLKAFADAVSTGDTEAINSIQTLMKELSTSQDGLAKTITETSGAFGTLIQTIETATKEPFQVVLEDNANDVATAVQTAIGSIPDETFKYINVITQYSSRSPGTPDGYNAQGLDYVPFDGFVSSLHKGERILTAAENKEYSQGKTQAPITLENKIEIPVVLDGREVAHMTYNHLEQIRSDRGQSLVRTR